MNVGKDFCVGEEGEHVLKFFIQSMESVEDEGIVSDSLTNVAEIINKRLHLAAVVGDRHVALEAVAKFRLKIEGMISLLLPKSCSRLVQTA